MKKLSKKEKQQKQIRQQLGITNERGDTWSGFRPSIMKTKKGDKKITRRENKAMCRNHED